MTWAMSGRVTNVAVRDDAYRRTMRLVERRRTRRSSCTYAGRRGCAGTASSFRPGAPAELVVRPRASEADIEAAIDDHTSVARAAARRRARGASLGLDRLTLTEEQGRREARARISLIAQSEAAALGVTYARISLRDQRSRWGSCSSRGTLSFNWRLVLAPHDVLDYVVVHEVCHLVELHHGPAFWQLVAQAAAAVRRVEALARRARLGDPRVLAARIARGLAASF